MGTSFVPTWRLMRVGISLNYGFTKCSIYITFSPEELLTQNLQFSTLHIFRILIRVFHNATTHSKYRLLTSVLPSNDLTLPFFDISSRCHVFFWLSLLRYYLHCYIAIIFHIIMACIIIIYNIFYVIIYIISDIPLLLLLMLLLLLLDIACISVNYISIAYFNYYLCHYLYYYYLFYYYLCYHLLYFCLYYYLYNYHYYY